MRFLLDGLKSFGLMLGLSEGKAEEALHSEETAKVVVARREFLFLAGATTALALIPAGKAFSAPRVPFVGEYGNLYMRLHTADPGTYGAHEASFPGYAPVAIERSGGNWDVSRGAAANACPITFPQAVGGQEVIDHFSLVDHRGRALLHGPLSDRLLVSNGVTVQLPERGLRVSAEDVMGVRLEQASTFRAQFQDSLMDLLLNGGPVTEAAKRS